MENATIEAPYAGFWRRVAATMIDNLILVVPMVLVGMFTLGIGALAVLIAYGTYFESADQRATWGKQACGIRVENIAGEKLSVASALGRQLLKLLGNVFSVFSWLVMFVPAAFTERRQGLHDMAVSSVVRRDPGKGIPDWAVALIAAIVPMVFVMGVLAAIAIPAYADYVLRAKVAAGRMNSTPIRVAVENAYTASGKLPLMLVGPWPDTPAMDGTDITYQNGRIEIRFAPKVSKGVLYLVPAIDNGRIVWTCESEGMQKGALPRDCK